MGSPGVVLVSKYVTGNSKKFTSYVNYINRDEATRTKTFEKYNVNDLDGYNQYMGNPEKSNGIFTKNKDRLSKKEKDQLKEIFKIAQENDSVMWQDVISFDNKWLEENGLYNSETGWINEGALQKSIRKGMNEVLTKEKMKESAVWSASIHFNTDNIHVHIASVEPYPTKEYGTYMNKSTGEYYQARRGNRKKSTLDNFKSKVANTLLDRDKELAKISQLIHEKIAPKGYKFKPKQPYMKSIYNDIYKQLPSDMRLWKYNNNALNDLRPKIDNLITMHIEKYHKEDFAELDLALKEEMEFRKGVYGNGDIETQRYEDYRKNKHHELYSKMGNALLNEMKEIRQEERGKLATQGKWNPDKNNWEKRNEKMLSNKQIRRLKKALSLDYQSLKNRRKYERLQQEIEYEKGR
ncbi:MobP2 family relaxase [Cytobacillus kochii]|uniref:MobP2 family relaxase n=1 Tax=Cytobacillus kochii TaxID=859143 RepID=UPI001CD231DC|nr:MobP2 family relaxase [Cytobacillus kochii]MCA1028844.1 relaxase MobL [Cytobacillus kochii]